jgi:hypothetical protein
MSYPSDERLILQTVNDVRDAGGVDHQALTHLPKRQGTLAAEVKQHQSFKSCERQTERPQDAIYLSKHNLLSSHDGCSRRHGITQFAVPSSGPLRTSLVNWINRQGMTLCHAH